MENYKSNSYKSKEAGVVQKGNSADKNVKKIVTGNVKLKKKSEVKKFSSLFVSEDVTNIKSYILLDVIIPNVKRVISDVIINSVEMALFGEVSSRKKNSGSRGASYQRYYERDDRKERDTRAKRDYDYDDIVLDSRGDADDVLRTLDDYVDEYGSANVADLYELVGKTAPYTANKYGWTDLRNASVERTRDGYWLRLPKALQL